MERQAIVIVGAGAAGLMAARLLSTAFDVTVLEAGNRIGGRINTLEVNDNIIEGGAEFIHGNLPLTLQLLNEAQINYVAATGKMYRKKNGEFIIQQEILNGWDALLQKMKAVKRDMSLHHFLQKHYGESTHSYFRNQVIAYAEGFDLADINEVSVRSLYREWSAESEVNYRIPNGYNTLTNFLLQQSITNGCFFLKDTIVQKVNWNQNFITVCTADGQVFEANKILITVPLKMLYDTKKGSTIAFNPLINSYTKAATEIGIGSVIKVVIKFKEVFWQKDAGFILSDAPYFATWWTQLPDKIPILTGWMGGVNAKAICTNSDTELKAMALQSLATLYGISLAMLTQNMVFIELFNWEQMSVSPGGYSFDTLKSQEARAILNTPLFNTIFFAGEALYKGLHPGTVEAALTSGQDAAFRILNNP